MKQLLSLLLTVVVVSTVAAATAGGTIAGFFDTELSQDNRLHAGTRNLELSGAQPLVVPIVIPSKWYSQEFTLINTGSLDALVKVHIPATDDPGGQWEGVKNIEAGALNGEVYYRSLNDYSPGSPVGAGTATNEPELVAEEGGQVGQSIITGLGVDAGGDDGPDAWRMFRYLDVKLWFDDNGDGDFDDPGELVVEDTLGNIACTEFDLGIIPGGQRINVPGGGWGSYFTYQVGDPPLVLPLMYAQFFPAGFVRVSSDATNLYVDYDTTGPGWMMAETHVYVGTNPPDRLSPGRFPYKHDPLDPPSLTDSYVIPLASINGGVGPGTDLFIATHATGTDGETAWGRGDFRKFKIEVHLQQVEDPLWDPDGDGNGNIDFDGDGNIDADDFLLRWWPTNVFQGDQTTFDIVFHADEP